MLIVKDFMYGSFIGMAGDDQVFFDDIKKTVTIRQFIQEDDDGAVHYEVRTLHLPTWYTEVNNA